jgi:hypothetical protein
MLNVNCYVECRYAEYRYAECCYAECRYAECRYAEHRGAFYIALDCSCSALFSTNFLSLGFKSRE